MEEEPAELRLGAVVGFSIGIGIIWITDGLIDRNNNTMMQRRQADYGQECAFNRTRRAYVNA